ncbi:3-(3-hydroxy-phenyl)propionate/3-hydroxycinnamic acid hydroxylase [Variibacter gotjawalensis]|uniref:3-(3-hydroxy-phenyl)propionate/3-hydroxycinnamic acid hydroxylase n=1 Tax=Variibacter gotjawalensis TaxID=1333996 RepID=A0A0S3PZI5_9BRAD|nr:FAD-dependent oxidoreductase [Variibacter gotjawalensis]NIK46973.1 3-(3-hydroxy-phenyl)propionate hydroxylase [Variibacter gotjawalensis]RZS48877.1 3-(3-hydroxy-phenyl)propionate hydroxylase [Variibacter gotjawalensis]BAT61136.1 3-(3-hydroxy-phenyl)propionate/3-hydroxycinnamic acid hydroxylase [Variibacter gotjawalensis]
MSTPQSAKRPHGVVYQYAYVRSRDQDAKAVASHPVVVVGAGPVGLTAAIDLALRDIPVVVLDDSDRIGDGSRGICYAKRTLEIFDRLGIGEALVKRGVTWKLGKVFLGDELAYAFDLQPEPGDKMPAFINLQQFYLEKALVDRAAEVGNVDLRWRNKVTAIAQRNDGARLTIETPDGPYELDAQYVIAADGARSTMRDLLGLEFKGQTFEDKFLIADVTMAADDIPTERRFWFDPPFHSGQSALMHRQPDHSWRIDLQLGRDADIAEELKPENYEPRIRRMLGDRDFRVDWISIYRFNCRRIDRFVDGRVIFAGDAAHQVSPFGARGANSGVQDAENLAWKLAAVLKGEAGPRLIDSYEAERVQAADENIGHSTRSTDFIAPQSGAERTLRNAVLALAPKAEFARRMVNSGRLSVATVHDSPLSTPDADTFSGVAKLGAPLPDAPVTANDLSGSLLEHVRNDFTVIAFGDAPQVPDGVTILSVGRDIEDHTGALARRLDAQLGSIYLARPDQHLCARWRKADSVAIAAAHRLALGH